VSSVLGITEVDGKDVCCCMREERIWARDDVKWIGEYVSIVLGV
jgi:hypothetical protein